MIAPRRAGLVPALALPLSLLVGCGGAARPSAPAKAPAPSAASCDAVEGILESYGRRVDALQQDAKGRDGIASVLSTMRALEEESSKAASALEALHPSDERLATSARAYAASARRAAGLVHEAARGMEAAAGEMGTAMHAVDDALGDLTRACDAKKAPRECGAIKTRLAALKTASEGWDPAAVQREAAALEAIDSPTLGEKTARVNATVRAFVASTRSAVARLDVLRRDTSEDALKSAVGQVQGVCGAFSTQPRVAPTFAAEWSSPSRADVRKLTVVVRTRPPAPLAATFQNFAQSDDALAPLYRGVAEGGFGSGLVLVKGEGSAKRVFVVTNRHVVDLADEAEILLDGGKSLGRVPVLYADGWYDLAVLELPKGAPFEHGFSFAATPAKDQAPVIATGFPGVGAEPSYQTTRGYVSNERFVVTDEGRSLLYVQHTAPIDGGSSGGPLTDESGALLGVNTLKLRGRENVGLAAPGFAVAEVAHYASELTALGDNVEWRRARARDACLALVGELGAHKARVRVVEHMVSSWLVAREGIDSFKRVSETDDDMRDLWRRDPLEAMRIAVLVRLWKEAQAAGGIDSTETCERPDERDWANLATSDRVAFALRFGHAVRAVSFRWERGQWRLASSELFSAPPPAPPAKPGKKAVKKGSGPKKGK